MIVAAPDAGVQFSNSPMLPSEVPRQETVQEAVEISDVPATSTADPTNEAIIQDSDTITPMETEVSSAPLADVSPAAEEIVQDHLQGPPATPATNDMEVVAPEHHTAQLPQLAVPADQAESSMDLGFDPTEAQQGYVQGSVPQAADAAFTPNYSYNVASMNEPNGMFMAQSTDMEATSMANPAYQWQSIPAASPHPQVADATNATPTEDWSWMYDGTPTMPLPESMDIIAAAPHDVPQAGPYSGPDTSYASFSSNDLQDAVFAAVPTLPEAPMWDTASTSYTAQAPPQQTGVDALTPAEMEEAMSRATEILDSDPAAFHAICAHAFEYNAGPSSTGYETSDLRSTSSWDNSLPTSQPQRASTVPSGEW